MICCTENICASWLHCGFSCDKKGLVHLQRSRDTSHKTSDLPSLIVTSSSWPSSPLTVEINLNKEESIWPLSLSQKPTETSHVDFRATHERLTANYDNHGYLTILAIFVIWKNLLFSLFQDFSFWWFCNQMHNFIILCQEWIFALDKLWFFLSQCVN